MNPSKYDLVIKEFKYSIIISSVSMLFGARGYETGPSFEELVHTVYLEVVKKFLINPA